CSSVSSRTSISSSRIAISPNIISLSPSDVKRTAAGADDRAMRNHRHAPLAALLAAGLLWGTTVPLTKLALAGWGPGWLTVARFAAALAGVGLVAVQPGAGASLTGDALVFGSLLLSAAFLLTQPGLLAGRDPVAVTAVQLAAAAVGTVPAALLLDGVPVASPG